MRVRINQQIDPPEACVDLLTRICCRRCHAKDLDCEISTRKVQFVGCRAHLLAEGKIWIYDKHMPEPS